MIIKKYLVSDMKEALTRAKYELGKDAVIISQRTVKIGKWFNPFKEEKLEVTVALEEDKPIEKKDIVETKGLRDQILERVEEDTFFKGASHETKVKLLKYIKEENKEEYFFLDSDEKRQFILKYFPDNCFEKKRHLGKINVFIGPTGVGKTTTIAKIAAREYLENKKKVGLITIDTFRIGAVEQLKTYANILGLPFEVVNEPSEMKKKITKLKYCDILLIDTYGTSPTNEEKIQETKMFMQNITDPIHIYLVTSISTDKDILLSIFNKYNQLHYDTLILTKLDESYRNNSNFWSILENNSFPIGYLCNGQDVPDDIVNATLDNFIAYGEGNNP